MPTVLPIKDRTAGCMSSFLVDHQRVPIATKVAVARMRWSSCVSRTTDAAIKQHDLYEAILKHKTYEERTPSSIVIVYKFQHYE